MSTDTITDRIFNLKSVASKLEKDSLAAVAELGGITDGAPCNEDGPQIQSWQNGWVQFNQG
jgi:hypothetical protein